MSLAPEPVTRMMAQNTEAQVACPARPGRHLLGRLTVLGFALWCKSCREEHTVSWAEVDRIRGDLRGGE